MLPGEVRGFIVPACVPVMRVSVELGAADAGDDRAKFGVPDSRHKSSTMLAPYQNKPKVRLTSVKSGR